MSGVSRRDFIGSLAAAAATLMAARVTPSMRTALETRSFEMLSVGDSLMSAQGLRPENKFGWLVKGWLENEVFREERKVNYKTKAHSGARLSLHKDEFEKMARLGDDPDRFHHPEINISFPCIETQIEKARQEYDDPASVDLILISGGITDVLVANVVNPFVHKEVLRKLIDDYCRVSMGRTLEKASLAFPKAEIVVVGYFPVISTRSDIHKIFRYLFKAISFPHTFQFALANPITRQLMKGLRKKMAERSDLWVTESDKAFKSAIESTNKALGEKRIHFVATPISAETCFGTPRSLLWETDHDNFPADEMYGVRKIECPKALSEIKYHHYGKYSMRMCEIAAIGHPNLEGSRVYADAIKKVIGPLLFA